MSDTIIMNARLKDGIVALLNKNNVNGIKQQVPDLVPFFEFYSIIRTRYFVYLARWHGQLMSA